MTTIRALRVLALALAVSAGSASAMAACTEEQAMTKMTELTNLLGPLMTRNPTLTNAIATEMQTMMLQPTSDETCKTYDRLIARARAGR